MDDLYESVANILVGYFSYEFYDAAIKDLQEAIQTHKGTANQWHEFVTIIHSRTLPSGYPLQLVNNEANKVIYENTDEEAYNWLDLMIANVTRTDGVISPYPQSIHGE